MQEWMVNDMGELISRERARHEFAKFFQDSKSLVDDCDSLLCMLPTIEAEPVKHGRWTENHHVSFEDMLGNDVHWYTYTCSECGGEVMKDFHYCPNCGAKMDLEDDNGKE